MKYSFFILFFLLIIVSCKRTNDSIYKNANYCSVKDNEDSLYLNIPEGYTTGDITLYVPQNEEEKNFMSDMMRMETAIVKHDYKTIVKMLPPDYWTELSKETKIFEIDELKAKVEKACPQIYEDKIKTYKDKFENLKYIKTYITDIKNRVQEGNNIMYLYESYNLFYIGEDSIRELKPVYSIAESIDNGIHWFTLPEKGYFSLLKYRFSNEAIDKVQRVN